MITIWFLCVSLLVNFTDEVKFQTDGSYERLIRWNIKDDMVYKQKHHWETIYKNRISIKTISGQYWFIVSNGYIERNGLEVTVIESRFFVSIEGFCSEVPVFRIKANLIALFDLETNLQSSINFG